MLPILAVGAVGVAIALERYITITRMRAKNRALWAQVEPAIMAGDFDKARELTGKDQTALARLLGTGLEMQGAVRRRDDVKEAMQESMMEILPQLEKRTHYLATFANLATLLGLLGTVIGIIKSFGVLASNTTQTRDILLAHGVSEALVTTASGLIIGIVSMAFYAVFRGKVASLVSDLESATSHIVNIITSQHQIRRPERSRVLDGDEI